MSVNKNGENSPHWKGDEVGLSGLHAYLKKHNKKPDSCQRCGKKSNRLDLANISGLYKRDISDFEWLCRKCHMETDGRLTKFMQLIQAGNRLYLHKSKSENFKKLMSDKMKNNTNWCGANRDSRGRFAKKGLLYDDVLR